MLTKLVVWPPPRLLASGHRIHIMNRRQSKNLCVSEKFPCKGCAANVILYIYSTYIWTHMDNQSPVVPTSVADPELDPIRIRRIRMFLVLPDPDPSIMSRNSKKTLIPSVCDFFITFYL